MRQDPPEHYGAITRTLHWLTALLVLVAFIYGPGGSEQRVYSAARDFDRQLHETLGLCVFALVLLRLVWRLVDARPEPVPGPRWMLVAAKATHGVLYLLLFAVPLTAIAGAWLAGHPLTLLAGLDIAPRLEESHQLGRKIAEVHGWLGDVILWLAGLHAMAALYHQFVMRDGTLAAMWPSRYWRKGLG
jgi:cytochrome b561